MDLYVSLLHFCYTSTKVTGEALAACKEARKSTSNSA